MTENTVAHILRVPEERHADFHAKLAKLAKRATKAKLPALDVKLLRTSLEPIKPHSKLTRTIFHYGVETVGIISLGGWSLVAVIEYLPDGTPIVREVPGMTMPEVFRTDARTCDYCALDRNRKETFVVSHPEKGHKRVGRNCLSEFLGVSPEAFLASVQWLKDLSAAGEGSGGGWSVPDTFTPLFLLTASARVVAVEGYRSKAAADAYNAKAGEGREVRSTAADTRYYLDAMDGRLPKGTDRYGIPFDVNKEVMAHFGEVTDADGDLGAAVLAFAKGLEGNTTYAYNVRTLAATELVEWKHAGFLVSAHGAYRRAEDKARETAAAPVAENVHLGKVGDKLTLAVTVANAQTFDGNYGTTTLVAFKTPTGTVVKWWATGNKVADFPRGAALTIKGTVKSHGEYKGTKETVLTRVSTL